ncbi:MAG: hypothetical protein AB7Q81_05955 [Gammaproteobacteria bacterium]
MRVLVVCNVDFVEWPLAFLEALGESGASIELTGLVLIDHSVHEHLTRRRGSLSFAAIHCLTEREREWMARAGPADGAALEARFGREIVRHAAIADRELSAGWVSGGVFPTSPLRQIGADPARRTAYLSGLFDFLDDLLGRGFDAVLAPPAQEAAGIALAHLARRHGITYVTPKHIGLGAKMCLFDDPRAMQPCFRSEFADGAPSAANQAVARAWLADFRGRPVAPEYMAAARRMTFTAPSPVLLAALAWRWLRRRPPEALAYPYPESRLVFELRRWFGTWPLFAPRFDVVEKVIEAPYVYYALHYEPEMSVSAACPEFTDQLAVIESLSKALPVGWRVVVKEHLPMTGRRPRGFLARIRRMPGVLLVAPQADGFALLSAARAVVTLTGTVGLEAVLLRRPVLFLGPSPIQIVEGGWVRADNLARLGDALDAALATPPADDAVLERFLACLFDAAVDLPAADWWGGTASVTQDAVARHMPTCRRMAQLLTRVLE